MKRTTRLTKCFCPKLYSSGVPRLVRSARRQPTQAQSPVSVHWPGDRGAACEHSWSRLTPEKKSHFSQAATAWNMSEGSSALPQTVAALHQYGLLVEHGWGDSRRIALSDLAISIIINPDQDPPARAAAVKEAALKPKIFAELWDALQRGHRDRATLIRFLTTEREARDRASFTRKGADDVLRLFGETLTYAGQETDDARTEAS